MKWLMTLLTFLSFQALAVETGRPAPDFSLPGINPKSQIVKLSDLKGKIVVLEWLNHGCPFVKKHYESGNMTSLQKKYTDQKIVWLSVISSAPGKQGHVDTKGAIEEKTKHKSYATDILLDPNGTVGKLYEAKTTPHMYIIDKDGTLVYQGAIDDKPDTDKASVPSAKNYVAVALDELIAGKKVTTATTKAYGCGVKYQ